MILEKRFHLLTQGKENTLRTEPANLVNSLDKETTFADLEKKISEFDLRVNEQSIKSK